MWFSVHKGLGNAYIFKCLFRLLKVNKNTKETRFGTIYEYNHFTYYLVSKLKNIIKDVSSSVQARSIFFGQASWKLLIMDLLLGLIEWC